MKDDNIKVDSDNRNLLILGFSPLILFALALLCAFIPGFLILASFFAIGGFAMILVVALVAFLCLCDRNFSMGGKLLAIAMLDIVVLCSGLAILWAPFD